MALTDDELHKAAIHRGLKLVKSRKRKPGVGDYGKFGLTDAAGKPLFGVGDDGLTASAQEIAAYLRKGEVSTWAESAKVTTDPERERRSADKRDQDEALPSAIRPRPRRRARTPSNAAPMRGRSAPEFAEHPPDGARDASPALAGPRPRAEVVQTQPVPTLSIRTARPADADAVVRLLASVGIERGSPAIRRAIASASARQEPVFIADCGGIIGLLAWTVIADILEGDAARITAIVVNEDNRRKGIGRTLYEAALTAFREREIGLVEVMSDIEVRNANGFFRSLGLKQLSYRFASKL